MADNTNIVSEQLPPNYLAEFFAGRPGANVPGIMPLLNQELVNRISGFGVEGANPYTYEGNRIAGFSPAQQQAFKLGTAGVGSYSPYLDKATATTGRALTDSDLALGTSANYLQDAISTGREGTQDARDILARVPGIAEASTETGLQSLLAGLGTQSGALDRLNQAAGSLDPSNISSFYNPYEEQVVQQTLQDMQESFAKGDINRRAQAIGSGAFGGSRSRLLAQELMEASARGAAKQLGAIRSGGFRDAQTRQLQQASLLAGLGKQQSDIGARLGNIGVSQAGLGQNLAGTLGTTAGGVGSLSGNLANIYGGAARDMTNIGGQAARTGLSGGAQFANLGQGLQGMQGVDMNTLLGIGAMQQDLVQRGLNEQYGDFVGQYNLPLQTLSGIGGLAAGFAPSLGQTQIQQQSTGVPSTNRGMELLGTGLSAYGAFNSGKK